MSRRARGLLGVASAAVVIGGILLIVPGDDPLAAVPRGLALGLLFGMPAVIGAIGALRERPVTLVVAGVLCLFAAPIAFSGVTLVMLLPALAFLHAGVNEPDGLGEPHGARSRRTDRPPARRGLRWIAIVALAVPVAIVAALATGIIGLILLVLFGALAPALARERAGRPRDGVTPGEAVVGLATLALVVGGALVMLANTEDVCWLARAGPDGLTYERIPTANDVMVGGNTGIEAAGCDGGSFTVSGLAGAGMFWVAAVALAVFPLPGARSGRRPIGAG